jgi:hypothetical protein
MQEQGVSKRVAVKFDQVGRDGEIDTSAAAATDGETATAARSKATVEVTRAVKDIDKRKRDRDEQHEEVAA